MIQGTVTAYYNGEFIKSVTYQSKPEIETIKETWRHLYGKRFDKMTIVINHYNQNQKKPKEPLK